MSLTKFALTGKNHERSKIREGGPRAFARVLLYLSFVLSTGLHLLLGGFAGLPFLFYLPAVLAFLAAQVLLLRHFGRACESSAEKREENPAEMGGPDGASRQPAAQETGIPPETSRLMSENNELMSFSFTISHEIKSPVRAIDGYARIFLEDYGQTLGPDARGIIEAIRNICKETITLSNKLLEHARIARSEPANEVVDLRGMIQSVFNVLNNDNDHGSARLIFESPIPHVIGDSALLRQAVLNIVSNSLKFTRGKEDAVITVGCERINGEDVFFIRDNGAGFDIDMRYSAKLFTMFQRMHTSDEFEGTGIGLAIVKKIILLHKGRVWITGEVGRGATVYFILPPEKVLR
jgi:signal transduction histidine kinase